MDIEEFVDQLFGEKTTDTLMPGKEAGSPVADQGEIDPSNLQSFVDRLLLRLFDTVNLMQYLKQVSILKKNGTPTVQLVFTQIPDDAVGDAQRVIAVPSQAYRFKHNASPYIGFEIPLKAEMFPTTA